MQNVKKIQTSGGDTPPETLPSYTELPTCLTNFQADTLHIIY